MLVIISDKASAWDKVHAMARRIPRGRVMNYGQIAAQLKRPLSARAVGWAMRACPDDVPWHRVVNRKGKISLKPDAGYQRQKELLVREGILFPEKDCIDLDRFLWEPDEEDDL